MYLTRNRTPGLLHGRLASAKWRLAAAVALGTSGLTCSAADPVCVPAKPLAPHPRLFVAPRQIERMVKGRGATYEDRYRQVAEAAELGVRDAETPMRKVGELERGILIQGRLTSLAIQWHRTRDRKYLDAALKTIEGMRPWLSPDTQINLPEGQYIAGVAVAYDLLYNDLTPGERAKIVEFARGSCVPAFLNRRMWWEGMVINWNPVCSSGVGMLALTMYEDLPDAQVVLDRVLKSHEPIFVELQANQGGWKEGLGYWNWTVHYLSLFCMSYERATGERHAGFRSAGFRDTLLFGQYFVPYGEECGFGDNQHGGFSSSLYAAAEHLGYDDVLKSLQDYSLRAAENKPVKPAGGGQPHDVGYGVPQDLLIEPDVAESGLPLEPRKNRVLIYPNQAWAMLADQWPRPNIYASARGGTSAGLGGHAQADLLSWNAVVGREKMIHNIHEALYFPVGFHDRAADLYERNQTSKNTLFVGGVSARVGSRRAGAKVDMSSFDLPCGPALRLDATSVFDYGGGQWPRQVCRLFVVVGDKGLLVLDRVVSTPVPVEARIHTRKKATFGVADVLLEGAVEKARMTFAADQPAVLRRATALLTDARAEPPTVIRWQTRDAVSAVTLATLLTRSADPVELKLESTPQTVKVLAKGEGWQQEVAVTAGLER